MTGVTADDANEALALKGLNLMSSALPTDGTSALVKSQSVKAGTKVPKGTVIKLEFQYSEFAD